MTNKKTTPTKADRVLPQYADLDTWEPEVATGSLTDKPAPLPTPDDEIAQRIIDRTDLWSQPITLPTNPLNRTDARRLATHWRRRPGFTTQFGVMPGAAPRTVNRYLVAITYTPAETVGAVEPSEPLSDQTYPAAEPDLFAN